MSNMHFCHTFTALGLKSDFITYKPIMGANPATPCNASKAADITIIT